MCIVTFNSCYAAHLKGERLVLRCYTVCTRSLLLFLWIELLLYGKSKTPWRAKKCVVEEYWAKLVCQRKDPPAQLVSHMYICACTCPKHDSIRYPTISDLADPSAQMPISTPSARLPKIHKGCYPSCRTRSRSWLAVESWLMLLASI